MERLIFKDLVNEIVSASKVRKTKNAFHRPVAKDSLRSLTLWSFFCSSDSHASYVTTEVLGMNWKSLLCIFCWAIISCKFLYNNNIYYY